MIDFIHVLTRVRKLLCCACPWITMLCMSVNYYVVRLLMIYFRYS